jgi:hypothetical protein
MSALKTVACRSAEGFLDRIRRSNDAWWGTGGASFQWVFRGIGDAQNWRLIPSAWRSQHNRLAPLIELIKREKLKVRVDDGPKDVLRRYHEWHAAEQEALYQFASLANETGFSVKPETYAPRQSPLHTGWAQQIRGEGIFPDIELMALAQHHGIPTRLLDWSGSPTVAAFFAASPLFRPREAKQICVWALDTSQLINSTGARGFDRFRLNVHHPSRGQNPYLHSQGGVLTELLGSENFFYKNDKWPSLEDVFSAANQDHPILIGHTLSSEHVPRLLTLLNREGVNGAMLMPTLDNVSKTVISRWESET